MKENINILHYFSALETKQEHKGYYYSVEEAVVIVILGLMCGLKNIRQIQQWASHEHVTRFLQEEIGIQKIPCYYWMLYLLALVNPESLSRCFTEWVKSMCQGKGRDFTVSVDGKTIRSTKKEGSKKSPLHIVSAQIAEMGMTVAQKTVDDKSNEIPAVQELLETMELRGCMVVADAMHCQKETARIITEKEADYLLEAKGNQKLLKEEIADYVHDEALRKEMDTACTKEKNRGRIECRTAYITTDIAWLSCRKEWPGLKSIGAIHKKCTEGEKTTEEWHFLISSRQLNAKELLEHARKEWSVETMHWLLDVNFGEDFCRVLNDNVQKNLNILRKAAINLLRRHKERTGSKQAFTGMMLGCLMEPRRLLAILSET